MSSVRALAKNYLRYWSKDGDGMWNLADNAPTLVHLICRTMPPTITRNMAYEAFRIVSGQSSIERPTTAILGWIQAHPSVISHLDAALASKNPPKTFAALVEKAYSAELLTARNHVTSCLEREILT